MYVEIQSQGVGCELNVPSTCDTLHVSKCGCLDYCFIPLYLTIECLTVS